MLVTDSHSPRRHIFVGLTFAVLCAWAILPASAQNASGEAPAASERRTPEPRTFDQQMLALQVQIAALEQRLEAHRNLVDRTQMKNQMELGNRLDALESQMAGAGTPVASSSNSQEQLAAQTRTRLNDMEDALRMVRGQLDTLMIQFDKFSQRQENLNKDQEFRFQQLEAQVERLKNGGVSLSEDPQVLGRLTRPVVDVPPAPVLVGQSGEGEDTGEGTKLVGEGDMPVPGVGADIRPVLSDAKKLYERALATLRAGDYGNAEADLAQLLGSFPSHELAGNAQYWLGETHYVRQDYKRAAQAFLAGYTKYAKSPKAPDSLLKLGITLVAIGEQKTGCDAFAELGAKFPDAPQAIVQRAEIEKRRARCDG
jgi:tol-pal system protein YbgF